MLPNPRTQNQAETEWIDALLKATNRKPRTKEQKPRQTNRNIRRHTPDTAQRQDTPNVHEVLASPASKHPGRGPKTKGQGHHQQGEPSLATRYQRNAISRPMQEIDIGYTEYGSRNFLIMIDRLSTYIRCQETKDKTTTSTIRAMESWFELYGHPERVRAGYSPSFRAGFNE